MAGYRDAGDSSRRSRGSRSSTWNTLQMSTSSPADLAVAFRSLHRRLRDAATEDVSPQAVAAAEAAVAAAVSRAADLLGCTADAESVGAALTARHASDWTDADLAAIQAAADRAARAIRELTDLTDR